MKKRGVMALLLCVCLLLSGCSALLEREYSSLQPHTSQSWDSGNVNQIEVESPISLQEGVLSLISRYRQTGTIRLLKCADETTADNWVSAALRSLQAESGLGAYAVDYIIYSVKKIPGSRNFDVDFEITYRRTEEQVKSIYYATNVEAVTELLAGAVEDGCRELVVHFSSFSAEDYRRLDEILRGGLLPPDLQNQEISDMWELVVYPNEENPIVIEILLKIS